MWCAPTAIDEEKRHGGQADAKSQLNALCNNACNLSSNLTPMRACIAHASAIRAENDREITRDHALFAKQTTNQPPANRKKST